MVYPEHALSISAIGTGPNGRTIDHSYGSGMTDSNAALDQAIGRLDAIVDGANSGDAGQILEQYSYLGLSTMVARNHPQTGINLTLVGASGSVGSGGDSRCVGISAGNVAHAGCLNNVGLDQFGRVANQNWVNSSGSTVDGYTYTYDSNGNVLSKNNVLDSAYSETYTYDSLNRLTAVSRGGAICGSCPATGQLGRQPVGGHASAFAGGRGRPRGGA